MLAGRYRIVKRLGSGGMATVFLAEDERLGREVAVKRMHAESPEEVAKRFRREAQLGAALNHPNIVSIYDIETDDENVLIVMEYVPGGTLKDALARGPLPHDTALKLLKGIGAALDYAHEHGIVHRDVKPANILLDAEGRAKLADLGIATATEVTSITKTGAVLGTASYMAPERLDGDPGGREADVYGLATVAYEALTGHKARQGRSPVEIAHMVMTGPPPDLRLRLPGAPDQAAEVLMRGMARDPAERPASAGELVRELCEAFERREPTAATTPLPPPGAEPRERRWLLPVAGLVAALIAVVFVLALAGGDEEDNGGRETTAAREQTETEPTTQEQPEQSAPAGPPADAVKSFYTLAAQDDFQGAWELAGPGVREQLGGYESFVGTLQSLESIEFPVLRTQEGPRNSATVQFDTVATHSDRIERCSGTAELTADDGGWVIEQLNVPECDREPLGEPRPGKGPDEGRQKKPKKPKKNE